MKTLKFSYNWNKKLDCNAFTTLRLESDYWQVDELYQVYEKGAPRGHARLRQIKTITPDQINDFIAFLDTGYNVAKTREIIKRMYPRKDNPRMYFMLFVRKK